MENRTEEQLLLEIVTYFDTFIFKNHINLDLIQLIPKMLIRLLKSLQIQ